MESGLTSAMWRQRDTLTSRHAIRHTDMLQYTNTDQPIMTHMLVTAILQERLAQISHMYTIQQRMWDLIADHGGAATATPDVGAAHSPGRRGGARARIARQHGQPA